MSQIKDEIKRAVPSRPHETRSQSDIQRLRVERLMKNPEKPVLIPQRPKGRGPPVVPEFVRNVMGSSAGAGSGEFHVYRHLRRKEYARQHYMHKKAEWEKLETDYHDKIEGNKRKAEEETAKKRAKRLKKKQNKKNPKANLKTKDESDEPEPESEDDGEASDAEVATKVASTGEDETINDASGSSGSTEDNQSQSKPDTEK